MVPGAIGNITSYGARVGITNIDLILNLLKREGNSYLEKAKKTDYKGAINKKLALLSNKEGGAFNG